MRNRSWLATLVALGVYAGAAHAEEPVEAPASAAPAAEAPLPPCCAEAPAAPAPRPAHLRRHEARWHVFSPWDTSLTSGGGVADFTFSQMRSLSSIGAAWDARVTFGTRSLLGVEVAYVGAYNQLGGRDVSGPAPYLMQAGLDSDLRVNLLPFRVQPYVFGGVGWNHMDVFNRSADPVVGAQFRGADNQLSVPAGAGLAGYFGRHATLDARFTYRAIFGNQIDLDLSDEGARADQYQVAARFGYVF
jgi:hypothetical protein